MNTKTTMTANGTMTVGKVASRYGTPEPQIQVRMPKGTSFRHLHAALHRLAAEIELATPAREGWVVQTDASSDEGGRVYLELANGDEGEVARGVALLRTIAR